MGGGEEGNTKKEQKRREEGRVTVDLCVEKLHQERGEKRMKVSR